MIQYKEIAKKIRRRKLSILREKLEDSLPSLKVSEAVKSDAISEYFSEKFGVPIRNYSDLDLFYRTLLERETGQKI